MRSRDLAELLLLAALWGGSFLFMRVAAPQFGPLALIALRVGIASLVLLPWVSMRGQLRQLLARAPALAFVALTSSGVPFMLYAWAALSLDAGVSAILNATTPLFTALVAWVWLRERLARPAVLGLLLGFVGVVILVWGKSGLTGGGSLWAVLACLAATLLYGVSANFTRRHLAGVAPLVCAAGSQLFSALWLVPLGALAWPQQPPSGGAWVAVGLLAVFCTGLAYLLYFRLVRNVGPSRAVAVTFLIPPFGMLWGALLLGESIGLAMIAGCAVILAGTGLATGVLRRPGRGA